MSFRAAPPRLSASWAASAAVTLCPVRITGQISPSACLLCHFPSLLFIKVVVLCNRAFAQRTKEAPCPYESNRSCLLGPIAQCLILGFLASDSWYCH